jgi:predicted mannosyl-3-phosphoglycerate phosphatase (HAD superfamily)
MKQFLITYTRTTGSEEAWHRDITAFIAELDADPELKGRIVYRGMKVRDDSRYYHFAAAADEQAIKALQQREFFKRYAENTRLVAGGEVSVLPLEIVAETAAQP